VGYFKLVREEKDGYRDIIGLTRYHVTRAST